MRKVNIYEEIEEIAKEINDISIGINDLSARLGKICYRTRFWKIAEDLLEEKKEE